MVLPQGSAKGGWIWLPQILSGGNSVPVKKEKVCVCEHAQHAWEDHTLNALLCGWTHASSNSGLVIKYSIPLSCLSQLLNIGTVG